MNWCTLNHDHSKYRCVPRRKASKEDVKRFAQKAHTDLSNFPEFGEETRVAIIDTAGMALYDAGFDYDQEYLAKYAKYLAG